MHDYPPGNETDAAIAYRIYGHDIIWDEYVFGGKRHRYPLIRMPSINSKSVPNYSGGAELHDLMERLANREGEVWMSVTSLQRNEDGTVTRHAKPYPYTVTLPNTFLSSEPRPLPAAVCEVLLRSLDMDEELRRLEREQGGASQ